MTWFYMEKIPKTPQKSTRTNKFSKVAGYQISIQKSIVILYTNNELSEKEI